MRHHFAPSVDWTIAVSRRFHGVAAVLLYKRVILPILKQHGTVVECHYASNDRHSEDYWVRRINTILAVTDIHVLIDIDRSGYVEYEFDKSEHLARHGGKAAPTTMLPYWQPGGSVSILKPRRILISDRHSRYSYSRIKRTFTVGIRDLTVDKAQTRLIGAIDDVKKRRNRYLRHGIGLRNMLPDVILADTPPPAAVAGDAYRVAVALASGASVPAIKEVTTLRLSGDSEPMPPEIADIVHDAEEWQLGLRTGAVAVPAEFRRRWRFMTAFIRDSGARLLGEEVHAQRVFRFVTSLLGLMAACSPSRCRVLVSRVATSGDE